MKYTNRYGLPPIVVGTLLQYQRNHAPVDGRIGVTALIGSQAIFRLTQKHFDDMTMDVSELFWAMEGSAIHEALDKFGKRLMSKKLYVDKYNQVKALTALKDDTEILTEKWLTVNVEGWEIRGVADVIDVTNKAIEDYKRASVWGFIYKERSMDSWAKQLNIYRFMAIKNGIEIDKLFINGFFRDWSQSKVDSGNYPEIPFGRVEVPVWDLKKTEDFIKERLQLFKNPEPVPCTPEERWRSGGGFALMVKGRKTAKKLGNSEEELKAYAEKLHLKNYTIEKREVLDRRCKMYCPVRQFCPFNKYNQGVEAVEQRGL